MNFWTFFDRHTWVGLAFTFIVSGAATVLAKAVFEFVAALARARGGR